MKNYDTRTLTDGLMHANLFSQNTHVIKKTQNALSDLKRAATLIEKAEQVLAWANAAEYSVECRESQTNQ